MNIPPEARRRGQEIEADWRTAVTRADKQVTRKRRCLIARHAVNRAFDVSDAMTFKSFFKHQMVDPTKTHRRRADKAADLKRAYEAVDLRDGGICWVTGLLAGGVGDRAREHNHLRGRRVKPEWVTDPDHIITCTRLAHRLITLEMIVVEGDDVRQPIRFHWASHVKPEQKPFRIASRRRSQQRTA